MKQTVRRRLIAIAALLVGVITYATPAPAVQGGQCGFCYDMCEGGGPLDRCSQLCGGSAYEYHCHPGNPDYNGCDWEEFFIHCYYAT